MENENSMVELESTFNEISTNVTRMWKSGVRNKLKLAEEITRFFKVRETFLKELSEEEYLACPIVEKDDNFYASLPFGKEVVRKFNRIGSCEWVMSFDVAKLPNCYNALDKLTSEKVCNDDDVLEYVKENITADTTRAKIDELVSNAKNPSSGDDKEEKEDDSNETRSTNIFSIKINKGSYLTPEEVAKLYATLGRIKNYAKEVGEEVFSDDVFNIELKANTVGTMMKKAKKNALDKEDWETSLEVINAA